MCGTKQLGQHGSLSSLSAAQLCMKKPGLTSAQAEEDNESDCDPLGDEVAVWRIFAS